MGSKRIPDQVKIVSLIAVDLGLMKPKKAAKKGGFHPRNFSTWRNDPRIAARLETALKAVHAAVGGLPVPTKAPTKTVATRKPAAPTRKKRVMSEAGRKALQATQKRLWDNMTPKQREARQAKMQAGRRKKAQK